MYDVGIKWVYPMYCIFSCNNAFVLMKYYIIPYENMTNFMFLKVSTLHLLVLYSITHGMRTESVVLHF